MACDTDAGNIPITIIETATTMIAEYGAKPVNGTIRECYGPTGELYCLPIYVINPPNKYGSEKEENSNEKIESKELKVSNVIV